MNNPREEQEKKAEIQISFSSKDMMMDFFGESLPWVSWGTSSFFEWLSQLSMSKLLLSEILGLFRLHDFHLAVRKSYQTMHLKST